MSDSPAARPAVVVIGGGGGVGIELAGEIKAVWPSKQVTLLDVADDVLGGPFRPELRAELRRQLAGRGWRCCWAARCGPPRPRGRASCGPSR